MAEGTGSETRHHSIGEVLAMLKEEHADVTISKIRFFESQGLIDPERTPSGYRKFYDADIERLRWILVQQRDNFLPLKVIKRRLEESGFDPTADMPDLPLPEPTLFSRRDEDEGAGAAVAEADVPDEIDLTDSAIAPDPEPEPEAAPTTDSDSDSGPGAEADEHTAAEAGEDAGEEAEPEPEPEPDPGPVAVDVPPAPPVAEGDPLDTGAGSVSLSALELAESAGVDLGLVADLERLGLIETVNGQDNVFDHEALVVARAAGVFMARGVEPRHLRMFKVAADRESGVLEQLVGPKLKKGGESRVAARAELNELVQLGETIQRSILRRSFGSQLD